MHRFKLIGLVRASLILSQSACMAAGGRVTADALNIRSAPTTESSIIGKAYAGETVEIVERESGFYKINFNGKEAYASADYVSVIELCTGTVTANLLNIRKDATTASPVVGQFAYGDKPVIVGVTDGWYQILLRGDIAYVSASYVKPDTDLSKITPISRGSVSRKGSEIVTYSKQFTGVPYVSGGSSPSGFDCSGFTSYVYRHFGVSLPRTASGQATVGVTVSKNELLPGDLVFFNTYGGISHVGIYVGGGDFIHATVPGDVVRTSSLDSAYYTRTYVTAKRIIQ